MCIKKEQPMQSINHNGSKITKPKPKENVNKKTTTRRKPITVNDLLNNLVVTKVDLSNNVNKDDDHQGQKVRVGTRAFIQIMLHSLKCSSCEEAKCKKMKMVMTHYIKCTKLKSGENCSLCRQLLSVVGEHALFLCPLRFDGPKLPCPVPMCDVMRATAALKA